jgi:hypothetical protein
MYVGKGWDKSTIPNIKAIPPPTIVSPGLMKGFKGFLRVFEGILPWIELRIL